MPKLSKATWEMARGWYETKGLSQKAIAERLNVTVNTVYNHVKKEGWVKGDDTAGPVPDDLVADTSAAKIVELEEDYQARLADMQAELDAREVELETQRQLVEEYKPTKDIRDRLFSAPADVEAYFGESRLRDMAERELAVENQKRWREGLPHLELDEKAYRAAIERIKLELVADRKRWVTAEGPQMRVMKMVKPDGTLVQIPVENQINNQAGSLQDGIVRYRDKNFKLTEPFLCAMKDCWEPADTDSAGRFTWNGYCTQNHRDRVEQRQGREYVNTALGR